MRSSLGRAIAMVDGAVGGGPGVCVCVCVCARGRACVWCACVLFHGLVYDTGYALPCIVYIDSVYMYINRIPSV